MIEPLDCPNATKEAYVATRALLISQGYIDQTPNLLQPYSCTEDDTNQNSIMAVKKRKSDSTLYTFVDRKMADA